VQQRVRLERQLAELSATLLPGHPRMRQIQADLAGLQRQIKVEVGKIVEGIEKGASVAAMREAAIKKSIEDMKARVVGTGGDQVKLRQLEAGAKSKRAELERLQARYEANRARADSRAVPNDAQIITTARPASIPSFPRRIPYAALVGVAVLLFGIAIVATKALFAAARAPKPAWSPAAAGLVRASPQRADLAAPSAAKSVGAVSTVETVGALASELLVRPPDIGGFRTLVTGETEGVDCGPEAVELARTLADAGADVMLVDWGLDGHGIAESLGVPASPGFTELLMGEAKFEDVVARLPASSAQLIATGGAADAEELLDADHLNLALDALDTAYDHIIIVGRTKAARALFETIQGRFDAGVIVADAKRRASKLPEAPGTFLGFEVTDIELFRLERPVASRLAAERLSRLMTKGGAEATAH
jgi:tyrosine-protein kinase Etk/Wzc